MRANLKQKTPKEPTTIIRDRRRLLSPGCHSSPVVWAGLVWISPPTTKSDSTKAACPYPEWVDSVTSPGELRHLSGLDTTRGETPRGFPYSLTSLEPYAGLAMVDVVNTLTVVRIVVITANTVIFGWLAVNALLRARKSSGPGIRRLHVAAGAASAAVAVGGIQRVALQSVVIGWLPEDALGIILERLALAQALVVALLAATAWRLLRAVRERATTSDSILAAFGEEAHPVDWAAVKLTSRQAEVLEVMAGGVLADSRIAEALDISIETVRSHVKAIFKATGSTSRIELVVAYHQHGDPHPPTG